CPWAHRTLIFRVLKKLEDIISVSVVHHFMGENGWTFTAEDGATGDTLYGLDFLHQIYAKADRGYSGRASVPVLWDKRQETIVSNESSEIIRMLNSGFDEWGDASLDFYPPALRSEIDRINALVYPAINNGVYRAGFATSQEAYEEAFGELFAALDTLEERLSKQRYLVGERITEADWRLFTTLVRFDPVYVGHFKCNLRRIADYPNLSNYLRDLYQVPGVSGTVSLHHIKSHYYGSHKSINPTGIIPAGPKLDYAAPHDRGRFRKAA
ncbi:MAG: glutathione S-transferase family protein, partial [Mesorhizobium sp.]